MTRSVVELRGGVPNQAPAVYSWREIADAYVTKGGRYEKEAVHAGVRTGRGYPGDADDRRNCQCILRPTVLRLRGNMLYEMLAAVEPVRL